MALFNGGYPATYQQMYPQYAQPFQQPYQQNAMNPVQATAPIPQQQYLQNPAPQQVQNQQSQSPGIIWVSGEAGARGYMVAPNSTVQLWDSDSPVIYLKSADASGMPSLKILDYTTRDQTIKNSHVGAPNQGSINPSDYVLRTEFDDLKARFEAFTQRKQMKPVKKEDVADE